MGAKQNDKMNMIYTLAFLVNLVAGIIISGGFVLAKRPILALLKVSPEMQADAMIYINIVGGGLFLQAGYNVMLQILRCNGYAKVGMYISVAINLINIVGNYLYLLFLSSRHLFVMVTLKDLMMQIMPTHIS